MKTLNKLSIFLISILIFTSTIQSFAQGKGNRGRGGGSSSQIGTIISDLPLEEMSAEEIASLQLLREEEKLARDVYLELFDTWNISVFSNIANSEQQHTDMIAILLQKYELDDPFDDERGTFENEELAGLYSALTEQGKVSLLSGLIVGATIEDLDIYDLQEALVYIDNQDIRFVYQNLQKGSRNHMRSFYSQILAQSGSYDAQYISAEELDAIVNSEMERGMVDENGDLVNIGSPRGRGKGKGRGNRGGNRGTFGCVAQSSSIVMSNYPNPANPSTTINYSIQTAASVTLSIYNVKGQLVRHFDMGYQNTGEYSVKWDALSDLGTSVPSGVYFYRLRAGNLTATRRLLMVK